MADIQSVAVPQENKNQGVDTTAVTTPPVGINGSPDLAQSLSPSESNSNAASLEERKVTVDHGYGCWVLFFDLEAKLESILGQAGLLCSDVLSEDKKNLGREAAIDYLQNYFKKDTNSSEALKGDERSYLIGDKWYTHKEVKPCFSFCCQTLKLLGCEITEKSGIYFPTQEEATRIFNETRMDQLSPASH